MANQPRTVPPTDPQEASELAMESKLKGPSKSELAAAEADVMGLCGGSYYLPVPGTRHERASNPTLTPELEEQFRESLRLRGIKHQPK